MIFIVQQSSGKVCWSRSARKRWGTVAPERAFCPARSRWAAGATPNPGGRRNFAPDVRNRTRSPRTPDDRRESCARFANPRSGKSARSPQSRANSRGNFQQPQVASTNIRSRAKATTAREMRVSLRIGEWPRDRATAPIHSAVRCGEHIPLRSAKHVHPNRAKLERATIQTRSKLPCAIWSAGARLEVKSQRSIKRSMPSAPARSSGSKSQPKEPQQKRARFHFCSSFSKSRAKSAEALPRSCNPPKQTKSDLPAGRELIRQSCATNF